MKRTLLIAFYSIFIIVMGTIVIASLLHPKNNLLTGQMVVGTVVVTVLFLACSLLWKKVTARKERRVFNVLFPVLLVLSGVALYILCAVRGEIHDTLSDYSAVYNSAMEMADYGELSYPPYFLTYSNNIKPMLILSMIFKAAHKIGVSEYYVTLIFSVLLVVGSIWAMGEFLKKKEEESSVDWRIPGLVYCMICLPVYVFTPSFYTDTMSFGCGVIALALIKKMSKMSGNRWIALSVLAAAITVFGISMKITSIIPLIAGAVMLAVCNYRVLWKRVGVFVLSTVLLFLLSTAVFGRYSIYHEAKETADPLISWFAIGMTGDGSWTGS